MDRLQEPVPWRRTRRDCKDCLGRSQNGTSPGYRTSTVRSTCTCRIRWQTPAPATVLQNNVSSLSHLVAIGPCFPSPLGRTLNFGIEITKSKNFSYPSLFSSSAFSSLIGTIGRVPTIVPRGRLEEPHCGSTSTPTRGSVIFGCHAKAGCCDRRCRHVGPDCRKRFDGSRQILLGD